MKEGKCGRERAPTSFPLQFFLQVLHFSFALQYLKDCYRLLPTNFIFQTFRRARFKVDPSSLYSEAVGFFLLKSFTC